MTRLVRCGDHRYAPAVAVCRHLFEDPTLSWHGIAAPEGDESEYGMRLYDDCVRNGPDGRGAGDCLLLCVHCVRKLRPV
jgi:hypothetical protein